MCIVDARWPDRAPARCTAAIGSALAARLHPFGIRTTADLVAMAPASAGDVGTVVLERLVRELNGVECDGFKPEPEASKATAVTRQFGVPVTELDKLCEAMVRRGAEKIRHQGLVSDVADRVYARALPPNPPSASRQTRMSPPSNDQRIIAGLAAKMMEAMYQPGGVYTKCGILLEELLVRGAGHGDSFAVQDPRARGLLAAMDGLNDRFGRGTVGNAAQGFGARAFDTKRGQKSPAWTTRLAEIPVAR